MSIYYLAAEKINGDHTALAAYKGKVLLIVNTASKCGFTPQFRELQQLYEAYKNQGFVVLGFPSDQFLNQEHDRNEDIWTHCQTNYHVSFPMFAKTKVKGEGAHPVFKFLTKEKKGLIGSEIKWNFTKFLVDRHGNVVKRYAPTTKPSQFEKEIKMLLKIK